MMEMNTKAPFVWDWESLVMFPSRAVEAPRKFQVVDSEFEPMEGFDGGSYGGKSEGLSGSSVSDLAYGSSSKSSKSASLESSSNREAMRESSKFTLEASDGFSHDLSYRKELLIGAWPPNTTIAGDLRASDVGDISIGSGESLIGLKLGKRTYFEDVAANGHTKASVMDSVPGSASYDALGKRSKVSSIEIPRCQVEGCNLDLSSAKDYHRKHRVCENHSKSPKVVICGVERRFCQQCSRFHSLAEFDQKKRSCRRRLSDHNARRRKPKPEVIQFNPMRLASSLHEGTNHMSLAFNKVPAAVPPRPSTTSMWDFTSDNSKLSDQEEKLRLFSTVKAEGGGGVGELLHSTQNKLQDTGFKLSYDSSNFLPTSKVSAPPAQLFHQGLQVPVAATSNSKNMEAATQDDLRALSLLSTNSWGVSSCDPQLQPQPIHANYWQGDKQPPLLQTAATSVQVLGSGDGNNHFQEFQLFKAPSESGFYHY